VINVRKVTQYKNLLKSLQWVTSCSMWTGCQADRRADMTMLIVAFHNFANAPKTN